MPAPNNYLRHPRMPGDVKQFSLTTIRQPDDATRLRITERRTRYRPHDSTMVCGPPFKTIIGFSLILPLDADNRTSIWRAPAPSIKRMNSGSNNCRTHA